MLERAIYYTEQYALEVYNKLSNQESEDRESDKDRWYIACNALDCLEEIDAMKAL